MGLCDLHPDGALVTLLPHQSSGVGCACFAFVGPTLVGGLTLVCHVRSIQYPGKHSAVADNISKDTQGGAEVAQSPDVPPLYQRRRECEVSQRLCRPAGGEAMQGSDNDVRKVRAAALCVRPLWGLEHGMERVVCADDLHLTRLAEGPEGQRR